jgi:hypothetical protein
MVIRRLVLLHAPKTLLATHTESRAARAHRETQEIVSNLKKE